VRQAVFEGTILPKGLTSLKIFAPLIIHRITAKSQSQSVRQKPAERGRGSAKRR
jgi:hypothetical protein